MAHRPALARFIALRCAREDVDDIVHDLWLKAQSVDTKIEKPLAYLYRMADRMILDQRRGASRGRVREGDWGYVHNRLSEDAESPTAERRLLAREGLAAVDAALASIGERAAQIFRRYRIDGLGQREIAREFDVSISTVESDLRKSFQVLLSLREQLNED